MLKIKSKQLKAEKKGSTIKNEPKKGTRMEEKYKCSSKGHGTHCRFMPIWRN